jgi:hypothetical protein
MKIGVPTCLPRTHRTSAPSELDVDENLMSQILANDSCALNIIIISYMIRQESA